MSHVAANGRGTPRRSFVGGLAASVTALLAGRWSDADAEVALPVDEAWVARIKGKHRQVVDCTSANGGMGLAYALNFIDTTRDALGLADKDFTSVVVYRHRATPLMLNDAMWAKYKIGEVIGVNDPATNAPATKNIFAASVFGRPGMTYEQVAAQRPVILAACAMALSALSAASAPKASVSPEEAKAEWAANLIPGAVVVPSGVYALNRAQQTGCTYCNGG